MLHSIFMCENVTSKCRRRCKDGWTAFSWVPITHGFVWPESSPRFPYSAKRVLVLVFSEVLNGGLVADELMRQEKRRTRSKI